jgi:8-oxo-dGTP diphosphatase
MYGNVKGLYGHGLYAGDMTPGARSEIRAALTAVRDAIAAIRDLPTTQARIRAVGSFLEPLRGLFEDLASVRQEAGLQIYKDEGLSLAQLAARIGVSKQRAAQIVKAGQPTPPGPAEEPVPHVTTDTQQPRVIDPHTPLQPSIVAAIVTSKEGVLVERRHDGRPLWTFPAGEAEPGEAPADTAIRETKEECGIQIVVSHVIGERHHPKTGRHMIYLAARPYQGTAVHNGDDAELAEVKWVHLGTAEELLVGMFGPVHEHLLSTLGGS